MDKFFLFFLAYLITCPKAFADDASNDTRIFYNGTGEVFFKAQEPLVLKLNNVSFVLDKDPESAEGTSENGTSTLTLKFKDISNEAGQLSSVDLVMSFSESMGYWKMSKGMISVKGTANGTQIDNTDVAIHGQKIEAPRRFSYHCSRVLSYKPVNDTNLVLLIKGIQVQPFEITDDRFGRSYDCQGFFSIALLTAIFLAILIGALLGWGISMLMSVNAPDRFDDPKGKPLVVNALE
ncbi:V-type proton ATPase subunit S1-like [Artemia franciscana]|uniref:Uncharacterized protein n=1 Tax=Artemia franciscana TaxID=6661 RepID=A0AA88HE27_ARTSF|nr:hypothetical protein QYM36_017385 [Artemia franciscana]